MSPVLAAALARAEAADAGLAVEADLASVLTADAVASPFAPVALDAATPHRVSTTLGRFLRWTGCLGHSAQRGEGHRS